MGLSTITRWVCLASGEKNSLFFPPAPDIPPRWATVRVSGTTKRVPCREHRRSQPNVFSVADKKELSYDFSKATVYTLEKDFPNIGEGIAKAIVQAVAAGEDVTLDNLDIVPGIDVARAKAIRNALAAGDVS